MTIESAIAELRLEIDGIRLLAWYRVRGFREVNIEPPVVDTVEGRAHVSFTIVEGEPVLVRSIDFETAIKFVSSSSTRKSGSTLATTTPVSTSAASKPLR